MIDSAPDGVEKRGTSAMTGSVGPGFEDVRAEFAAVLAGRTENPGAQLAAYVYAGGPSIPGAATTSPAPRSRRGEDPGLQVGAQTHLWAVGALRRRTGKGLQPGPGVGDGVADRP
jgi:hypothetical protein